MKRPSFYTMMAGALILLLCGHIIMAIQVGQLRQDTQKLQQNIQAETGAMSLSAERSPPSADDGRPITTNRWR